MRVNVYLRRTNAGEISKHVLAAAEGFKRHGIKPNMLQVGQAQPCDLAVCWGVKKKAEMASGRRAMILERGYVGDRLGTWTSCSFDGLNGRADFRNAGMDSSRWDRLFAPYMEPWFDGGGDYVLVMGQVAGDAALAGVNIDAWAVQVLRKLDAARIPARFRPHPLGANGRTAAFPQATGTLAECLERARWVVTYNSNSGVDAVLAGVPTVAVDRGSMAWAVTGRLPFAEPPTPDRTQWAAELAWTQWSMEEIRKGDAWDHLRGGLAV